MFVTVAFGRTLRAAERIELLLLQIQTWCPVEFIEGLEDYKSLATPTSHFAKPAKL